ncbi:Rare lipoprotein A (RlpA)-like double-psi beta-barrel domain-containing [Blumeria hordei DH14]|uniref:Rare lipoprotein A (RlpA)-like double-psi beta-barrel domain-containing n=1 Tax=Blumeria graminis f. sp. hordei (strain DH14) TaxID=546991 RepID=N1JHL9_BLUG1|nr:Rare lipoprotein A (RlpA)-like double-psi beta-barrel domain-containing [Blumeria hordei DH14]
MKSAVFSLAAALAAIASAQPHRHSHRHMAQHHKRDANSPVVWVTKPEVKVVDVTTTVWIAAAESESTSMAAASAVVAPANPTETSPIEAAPTDVPSEEDDGDDPSLPDVPFPDEPDLDLPAPGDLDPQIPSSTDPEAPSPSDPVPEPLAPVNPEPATPAPAEPEVPAQPAPVPAAPANETDVNHTHKFADSMTELASGSACSASSPCSGDITYYDPGVGMGACGWQSTKNEPVVALPYQFMGAQSNGNPYCGKTVTIKHGGKTSTAKIVDKCMGCNGFSIDLSDAAFTQLSALSVGRTDATWWINN